MEAQARVGVLVEVGAIEIAEAVRIGREVAGHPVEHEADAGLMAAVDEARERLGRPMPAGRREQADRLIAPGAVERKLRDREQLEVGEAHLLDVGHQPVGQLIVAEVAVAVLGHPHPGADVALVDRDRRLAGVGAAARRHPVDIRPGVIAEPGDHGCGLWRMLGREGERVGLERQELAVRALDLVLVDLAAPEPRQEQLPDAAFDALSHRMAASVPAVESADHRDPLGIRRPDQEGRAGDALQGHRMGAELLVEAEVAALGHQIDVELAQDRREPVGVVDLDRVGADLQTQAIAKARRAVRQRQHEQAIGVHARELSGGMAARRIDQPDPGGLGLKAAHDQAAVGALVHAELAERIAVIAAHQRLDRGRIDGWRSGLSRHGRSPPARAGWSRP